MSSRRVSLVNVEILGNWVNSLQRQCTDPARPVQRKLENLEKLALLKGTKAKASHSSLRLLRKARRRAVLPSPKPGLSGKTGTAAQQHRLMPISPAKPGKPSALKGMRPAIVPTQAPATSSQAVAAALPATSAPQRKGLLPAPKSDAGSQKAAQEGQTPELSPLSSSARQGQPHQMSPDSGAAALRGPASPSGERIRDRPAGSEACAGTGPSGATARAAVQKIALRGVPAPSSPPLVAPEQRFQGALKSLSSESPCHRAAQSTLASIYSKCPLHASYKSSVELWTSPRRSQTVALTIWAPL